MRCAAVAVVFALAPALARAAEPAQPKAEVPARAAARPEGSAPAAPKPVDTSKALYALGLAVASGLEVFSLSPAELDTVLKGVRDGWAGKPKLPLDATMQAAVADLARTRAPKAQERAAAREKEQGARVLAKAAKEPGAKRTPSGAIVIPLREGTGPSPAASETVKVHYIGTLVSGRIFDTSAQRGPAELTLSQEIKCWAEGLQLMKVGGKAKIVCPPDLAYGPTGNDRIPGNAVLTLEVELLDIVK